MKKEFQKNSKKCLTNKTECAIINKLAHEREHSETSKDLEVRTLKIKQYREKLEGALEQEETCSLKLKIPFK